MGILKATPRRRLTPPSKRGHLHTRILIFQASSLNYSGLTQMRKKKVLGLKIEIPDFYGWGPQFTFLHSWSFVFLKAYVLQSSWPFSQEKKKFVELKERCLKFGNDLCYLGLTVDIYSDTKAVKISTSLLETESPVFGKAVQGRYKPLVLWNLFGHTQNEGARRKCGQDGAERKVLTLHLDKTSYF